MYTESVQKRTGKDRASDQTNREREVQQQQLQGQQLEQKQQTLKLRNLLTTNSDQLQTMITSKLKVSNYCRKKQQ